MSSAAPKTTALLSTAHPKTLFAALIPSTTERVSWCAAMMKVWLLSVVLAVGVAAQATRQTIDKSYDLDLDLEPRLVCCW